MWKIKIEIKNSKFNVKHTNDAPYKKILEALLFLQLCAILHISLNLYRQLKSNFLNENITFFFKILQFFFKFPDPFI